MALLAEEIVEEWLNRQGYFTIRGAKVGLYEIDLLAIKPTAEGFECRHIEVTASVNPISYLTDLPKGVQEATGRKPKSAKKRTHEELTVGVQEWVHKKFLLPKKVQLRKNLCPGEWSLELVVNKIRHENELPYLEKAGIRIHRLATIIEELSVEPMMIKAASGSHLVELVLLGDRS